MQSAVETPMLTSSALLEVRPYSSKGPKHTLYFQNMRSIALFSEASPMKAGLESSVTRET